MCRGGGVALHPVHGAGVAELHELRDVASRQAALAVLPGDGERPVPVDAGDGPGVAVRHRQIGVVAAGHHPIPHPERTARAGHRARVVDPAGGDESFPDRVVQRVDLLIGVRYDHCLNPASEGVDRSVGEGSEALGIVGVHPNLATLDQRVEHTVRVRASAHSQAQPRVLIVNDALGEAALGGDGAGEPVHRLQAQQRVGWAKRAARSRTPPRPTAGSWCRSPTSATRAACSSAMVSRARAASWSSIPASSTSSRSPARSTADGAGPRCGTPVLRSVWPAGRRVQTPWSSQRNPCCHANHAADEAPVAELFLRDPGSFQRRGDHPQTTPGLLQGGTGRGQRGRLPGPGRTLHHHQLGVAGQGVHDVPLCPIKSRHHHAHPVRRTGAARDGQAARRTSGEGIAAGGETGGEVGFDLQNPRRGQRSDVLRQLAPVEQRHALGERAGGHVLGQFDPDGGVSDDVRGRDQRLDLAAQVSGIPPRAPRPHPRHHLCGSLVAVDAGRPVLRAAAPVRAGRGSRARAIH